MTIQTSPSANHLKTIGHILDGAVKDDTKRRAAYEAIVEAIETYRDHSHPYVEGDQRSSVSTVAETRRQLVKAKSLVGDLAKVIEELPFEAKRLLAGEETAGLGQVTWHIEEVRKAIGIAQEIARDLPNKSADHFQTVLARDVAKALQDAGVKISKTAPGPLITGRRSGAVYGRILQAAIAATGRGSVKVQPIMVAGIDLLNDPAAQP